MAARAWRREGPLRKMGGGQRGWVRVRRLGCMVVKAKYAASRNGRIAKKPAGVRVFDRKVSTDQVGRASVEALDVRRIEWFDRSRSHQGRR